jgi:rhamnogalacturonyl hydrolase YesR
MKLIHLQRIGCLLFIVLLLTGTKAKAQSVPSKQEVVSALKKVNDSWLKRNPNPGNNQWARAAYFTGNIDFYKIYPKKQYLAYTDLWATQSNWSLNGGSTTRNADNQCIGQVYIDLFMMDNPVQPYKIEKIQDNIKRMVNGQKSDDWWWIDALYMAMPVFTRLGVLQNDEAYFEKMHSLYLNTKVTRKLYNSDLGLWYRDESFAPPYTTPNGRGSYWSRGNGWVFGAHVRVIQLLPENNPHRAEYIETFQKMALALKNCQRTDGFWNVSLDDPNDFGGPETSGTAFFTYGMAWGVNNGLLDSTLYAPVIASAWNGLTTKAVHDDGFLGYVQGVGSNPASSQPVTYYTTADFGVGAFLLAGSEVAKLATGEMPQPTPFSIDSITVPATNQILVWFSEPIDPNTGRIKTNYTFEGAEIENIVINQDSKTALLIVSNLELGKHTLKVQNITSTLGNKVENGETVHFINKGNIKITASSYEEGSDNTPDRTLDFDFNTRWSALGIGEWILYDLGGSFTVSSVDISFYKGDERYGRFAISLSDNGTTFKEAFNGRSSGNTAGLENYDFTDTEARFVKITGFGNSASLWNSITETRINTLALSKEGTVRNAAKQFRLYPNPLSDNDLYIEMAVTSGKIYTVQIFDLTGKQVMGKKVKAEHDNKLYVPGLNLRKGSYQVRVNNINYNRGNLLLVK